MRAPPNLKNLSNRWDVQPLLAVKRRAFRQDDEHADQEADDEFRRVRISVLKRDANRCRFCNFASNRYQEVHHIDDDHRNNKESNLLTVCNLCHLVHHIGFAAQFNMGFLAYIPELTQTEVNDIVRAIFSIQVDAKETQNAKDMAKSLYSCFQNRGDELFKNTIGSNVATTMEIARCLSEFTSDADYENRQTLLAGFRFVATQQAFKTGVLEYYLLSNRSTFFKESIERYRSFASNSRDYSEGDA